MKDGYIRVASASIDTLIGNVKHNANEIKKVLKETREKKAQVVVFPELVLSGYTLEDLFLQNRLLNECLVQLEEIMHDTKGHQQIVVIGLPFHYQNNLYNVSAVLYDGNILGIVPKYHIPNYNEYYEGRRFTPCFEDNIEIELFGQIVLFGRKVVFACQNLPSFTLGVEICEDLWLPNAPSNELALNGATVICNTSASNELTAKKDYRRNLVSMQSAKLVSGYIYSNAGSGESTTDVVFSGHHLICENGTIINESTGFDAEVIYGDLDVEKLISERRKMTTYQSHHEYDYVYFDMDLIDIETNHYYDPHPFVPSNPALRELRCKEVFEIQTRGLMQRLKATHINKVVIGISGGLDSTLALLVCVMAFEKLGYDKKNIYAITMPCFGTTSRTKNNALGLMEELGVTSQTVNIAEVVRMQFKNIDQDENVHDVTYENVQARERTEILMNKANQIGGLVIGTGDLSEVALGWSTYNGDHMSMYGVNVSVPKTLVRHLVRYYADTCEDDWLSEILLDILDTPVSPELLPPKDGEIAQKTEDLVGPYELHDFFLYYMLRAGYEPDKIFRIAVQTFEGVYDREVILKWLKNFYRRFFMQQFKRSCLPDGPKVGTVAVSPRGDLRMSSDSCVRIWMDQVEKLS